MPLCINKSDAPHGAVFLFRTLGASFGEPRLITQTPAGANEGGDRFGAALARGDFDADDYQDLAVGAPGEDYLGSGPNGGAVFLFAGSNSGPVDPVVFGQGPAGANEGGDRFGIVLAVGDFNGDDFDDLAVGAPGEEFSDTGSDAGIVFISSGSDESLGDPIPSTRVRLRPMSLVTS